VPRAAVAGRLQGRGGQLPERVGEELLVHAVCRAAVH
jgi:hypothetical protein